MKFVQTETFERDVRKLDGSLKPRLKKAIEKISQAPFLGKPLKHLQNVFSERVLNFRLIYRVKDDELLLVCFKNREGVYAFLKENGF